MDVKNIIFRINQLSHKEKHHILNILKANNIEYTKNTNGFFFNFLKIKDDTVDKIIKLSTFSFIIFIFVSLMFPDIIIHFYIKKKLYF